MTMTSQCCCRVFLCAEVFIVVHSEQELGQVGCGGVHFHPRHNLKEERGMSLEVFGDALDLCLLPGTEDERLGDQQQCTQTIAQLHHLLETMQDLQGGSRTRSREGRGGAVA